MAVLAVVTVLTPAAASGCSAAAGRNGAGQDTGGASGQSVLLDPELARRDLGEVYTRGCASNYLDDQARPCVFDDTGGSGEPVVAIAGDSKAAQWVPTLQVIAEQQRWKLVTITKAGCAFSDTRRAWNKGLYASCVTWNAAATEQIRALHPDLLLTTQLDVYPTLVNGRNLRGGRNREEMVRGLAARITTMQDAGIPVATVAETPRMGFDTVECVSENATDPSVCGRPQEQVLPEQDVVATAAGRTGAGLIDLTATLCPDAVCPALQGDVLIYRDGNHMTATYARSLAQPFRQALSDQLEPQVRDRLLPG